MGLPHLVKIGLMGTVDRFDAPDFRRYDRDTQVICRTQRGLEHGTVLCDLSADEIESGDASVQHPAGELLRQTGPEDRMILERLERFRDKAFAACNRLLEQQGVPGVLVDVEHLFDGESVHFYFLGQPDERLNAITEQLAATYERKVRFRKFAETLANGCGPDCGTGIGCGTGGGCSTCSMAGGCGSAMRRDVV